MRHTVPFCFLLAVPFVQIFAQDPAPSLAEFFQQRLAASADTPPPPYESLLRVIDPISKSNSKDIEAALPLLSSAVASAKENLPVEAAFAFHEISQRPDGGILLRSRIPEIGALMERPDERLSGSAVLTLRYLTSSDGDLSVPIMVRYLSSPAKPSLVKAEIVSTLLKFRPNDPLTIRALQDFLKLDAEVPVRVATLEAISSNHVNTMPTDNFAIQSLGDSSKYVKVAAIRTVHALGSQVWNRAQPAVTQLAVDPSGDQEVRAVAEQELKSNIVTAAQ